VQGLRKHEGRPPASVWGARVRKPDSMSIY